MRLHPFRFGALAVLAGLLAWCLEWRFSWHVLNPVVFCAKVLGLFALVYGVRLLGEALFRSWRSAAILWFLLSAGSVACLFSAIPFRSWMPRWANDGTRRWYYEGMPNPENDYQEWLAGWRDFRPHLFEASVFPVFFAILLLPCVVFRMRLWTAGLICLSGYAFLAIAPVAGGYLAFDYDIFHLGIALDSIALSLWPLGLGYSNAHSIFTLCFLLLVFAVSHVFLSCRRHLEGAAVGGSVENEAGFGTLPEKIRIE